MWGRRGGTRLNWGWVVVGEVNLKVKRWEGGNV